MNWNDGPVMEAPGRSGSIPIERSPRPIAMYRKAGYVEVPRFNDEPYAHHWFEKRLR